LAASEKILNINYDITKGGPTVYEVENNSIVNINLKFLNNEACESYFQSKIAPIDPNNGWGISNGNNFDLTGFGDKCKWYFADVYYLSNKEFINLVNSTYNEATEMYNFQFEINNVTSKDVFPFLVFGMGDELFGMSRIFYDTVAFRLKLPGEVDINFEDVYALELDTEVKELDVVKDDVIEVRLQKIRELSPPENVDYKWYLDNADEIRSSADLEPLNLLENKKSSDEQSSVTTIERFTKTGDMYSVFKFKVTGEKPSQITLSFVHHDFVDREPVARAKVVLRMNGNEKKVDVQELEYTVSKEERNPIVEVDNNSMVTIHVKNTANLCNPQKYSECEWYFVKGDLDNYGYIDYLGSTYSKEKDTYDFKFKFENLTLADVLPNLEFNYGPVSPSDTDLTPVDSLDSVVVHLANVGQVDLTFDYSIYDFMKDTIHAELYVKTNSIVQIQFNKICSSTDGHEYHWYLSNFSEDENVGFLNIEGERAKGSIKENQFPLPPGSCMDEVFKFRIKGRARANSLPVLKFVHHEEGKSVNSNKSVYVTLKMAPEEEEGEKKPLKELDVSYDSEKTVYAIEEGSYLLNVHIKNLSKDDCLSVMENASDVENDSTVQCSWRFNDVHYYNDGKQRYDFLEYRGRTYQQETDSFIFKFQINNLKSHNFFPYLFFYYGPNNRDFKDKNPENYFKPLRLKMAVPGSTEMILKDLPVDNNELTKKEVEVQKNDVIHVILNNNSEYHWVLSNIQVDKSSNIEFFIGGVVDTEPYWEKEHTGENIYNIRVKDTATPENIQTISFEYQHVRYSVLNSPRLELSIKLKEGKKEVKDVEEEEDHCMKDTGYPCCRKTTTIAYTDRDGSWGIEDGQWCMLTISMGTCQPIDDYPVCTSTKTVVFVDTLQWGVENDEWCIIC